MEELKPVIVTDLFPKERRELLKLLARLSEKDWIKPTSCPKWSVKDIALHLLGDDLGLISRKRDKFNNPDLINKKINNWEELVSLINEQNSLWVQTTRRISPQLLHELLELTGKLTNKYFQSLNLYALGGPVSWAGPNPAPVWLDVAREYTERWIHQQQIREAVDKPGIETDEYLTPLFNTFIRALPHTYRDIKGHDKEAIQIIIRGKKIDNRWYLVKNKQEWELYQKSATKPKTIIKLDYSLAWKLLTKGIDQEKARQKTSITGNIELAIPFFKTVSIIA